jgi:hypothetical protein
VGWRAQKPSADAITAALLPAGRNQPFLRTAAAFVEVQCAVVHLSKSNPAGTIGPLSRLRCLLGLLRDGEPLGSSTVAMIRLFSMMSLR